MNKQRKRKLEARFHRMEVLKPTFEKTKSEFQDSFVSNNVVKKGRPKKTQAGNSKLTVETKEKNK